jgi:hypothetical protein
LTPAVQFLYGCQFSGILFVTRLYMCWVAFHNYIVGKLFTEPGREIMKIIHNGLKFLTTKKSADY